MTKFMNAAFADDRNTRIGGWFEQYGQALVRFVKSLTGSRDEAEDIAQEIWYQLTLQQDLDAIRNVGSWLFSAARNKVINLYRKYKTVSLGEENRTEAWNAASSDKIPDAIMEQQDMIARLKRFVETLPESQREVFEMHEMMGYSFREIAGMTGKNEAKLISLKHQAMTKIRKHFQVQNPGKEALVASELVTVI